MSLPRRSLSGKLSRLVLTAILIALGVVMTMLIWQEAQRYASSRRETLIATAQIFAAAASEATSRDDMMGALSALRAIGKLPGLTYAGIANGKGVMVAQIGSVVRLESDIDFDARQLRENVLDILRSRSVSVIVPVIHNGEQVGKLLVISDANELFQRIGAIVATMGGGALLALAMSILVASRLQRSITAPVHALIGATQEIATRHDYSRKIAPTSNDEVGDLVASFNNMLAEIGERDVRLARHLERLEDDVAERTRELRIAKDVAESANAAKSDFLATMSHEIRTPLNGLLVMAELLASARLAPTHRRYAEVIGRSGKSLLAIINDILDFAKVEAGKMELERIETDPADVLDTVGMLFSERAQSKGLDFAVGMAPNVPRAIISDPVRLGQVIGNLANNAIKFTETGSISVYADCPDGERGHLRIRIEDTGIGIPADKIGSLFGSFSQVDQSITRRFGGTGLGLAISKRIVEAMGGKIGVTSTVGQGSCFEVLIPVAAVTPKPAATLSAPRQDTAYVALAGGATTELLSRHLNERGYRVLPFDLSALASLAAPSLIVADERTLAALESRLSRRKGIDILAISTMGDASPTDLVAGGQADYLMRRPLSIKELRHVLEWREAGNPLAEMPAQTTIETAGPERHYADARVLIVDDNAVNREVAREALLQFGIRAEAVNDGHAAIEAVASKTYDLVLMDGSMPDLDGFETTRRIREAEKRAGGKPLPIVALTAHVVGSAADAWRRAGMNGVLYKPFTLDTLGACLHTHLTPSEPGLAPEATAEPELRAENGETPLFDTAKLEEWRDLVARGRGDFVHRIADMFCEHLPASLETLSLAVSVGDVPAAGEAAHSIKSMCLNMGALRLANLAVEFETMARIDKRLPDPAELRLAAATALATLRFLRQTQDDTRKSA